MPAGDFSSSSADQTVAMGAATRSMSWLGGLFHLPIASGPYLVSVADVATAAGATSSDSRGVFLRLFYPRAGGSRHTSALVWVANCDTHI